MTWRYLLCIALFSAGCPAAIKSAPLQDPIIVTPVDEVPARAKCPMLPPVDDKVTSATLHIAEAPRDVGPFRIALNGYVLGNDPNPSYRPILLKAQPGGHLILDLVIDSSAGATISNLHTHGLVVTPRPPKSSHGVPCPAGDYIFLRVDPANAHDGPAHQAYQIDIPRTLPARFFNRQATGRVPYPADLYWFHAHFHGLARPQVMQGMSGMISVGDEKAAMAGFSAGLRNVTDVRYLGLRDIQVNVPCPAGTGSDKSAGRHCETAAPAPSDALKNSSGPATEAGGDYGGGLCGTAPSGLCGTSVPDKGHYQYWVFTVNGQQYPSLQLSRGRNQLWRVANLSANLSYVLKLCPPTSALADGCTSALGNLTPFTVLAVDGVQAGTVVDATTATLGLKVRRLLLMPGSRATILLRNDGAEHLPSALELRSEAFNTGPGPIEGGVAKQTGDLWPEVALAHVDVEQSRPGLAAPLRAPEVASLFRRTVPIKPKAVGRDPATIADCSFLPRDEGTKSYRRQIFFDQDSAFKLGSQRVDQDGNLVKDGRNVPVMPFHMKDHAKDDFPPGRHVCATLHRGEVWELINMTNELHNFHIHQGKFRLARSGDIGFKAGTPSFSDPAGVLGDLVSADVNAKVDLWHDTFPVPPRQGDTYGRVFIFIPFEAEEQVGRFVFHCHILEHEDNGMMAAIEVVRQRAEPGEQRREPSDPAGSSGGTSEMHHHNL